MSNALLSYSANSPTRSKSRQMPLYPTTCPAPTPPGSRQSVESRPPVSALRLIRITAQTSATPIFRQQDSELASSGCSDSPPPKRVAGRVRKWTHVEHAIDTREGAYRVRLRGKYIGTFPCLEQARRERDTLSFVLHEDRQAVVPVGGLTLDHLWQKHEVWRIQQGFKNTLTDRSRWKCHVSPELGHLPANRVTPDHVMDLLEKLQGSYGRHWCMAAKAYLSCDEESVTKDDGGCTACGKKQTKLRTNTVKNVKNLISATLTFGVWRRLLDRKIMTDVVLRAPREVPVIKYLSKAELESLLNGVPEPQRSMVGFAAQTGLRLGEQMSLELADVHLDAADPHVLVQFGGPKRAPTKTGRVRVVYLTERASEFLKRWLEHLPEWAPKNPLALVFPTPRGACRGRKAPRGWHEWLASCGLDKRGITWHSLRHSFATLALNGELDGTGWELSAVQSTLGHTSQKTTEIYARLLGLPQLLAVRRGTKQRARHQTA